MEEATRVFRSYGMLWNDGDIPRCSYCNKSFDEVDCLHETPYSGDLCCDDEDCRERLINDVLHKGVEEIKEDDEIQTEKDIKNGLYGEEY